MTLPDGNDQMLARAGVYRAEGLLAERFGIDIEQAAEMLRTEATLRAMTISDVAREVLTGERSRYSTVLDPWGSC